MSFKRNHIDEDVLEINEELEKLFNNSEEEEEVKVEEVKQIRDSIKEERRIRRNESFKQKDSREANLVTENRRLRDTIRRREERIDELLRKLEQEKERRRKSEGAAAPADLTAEVKRLEEDVEDREKKIADLKKEVALLRPQRLISLPTRPVPKTTLEPSDAAATSASTPRPALAPAPTPAPAPVPAPVPPLLGAPTVFERLGNRPSREEMRGSLGAALQANREDSAALLRWVEVVRSRADVRVPNRRYIPANRSLPAARALWLHLLDYLEACVAPRYGPQNVGPPLG